MTVRAFIDNLRSLGVDLWVDGGLLRYKAPKEFMTKEILLIGTMARLKPDIMAALAVREPASVTVSSINGAVSGHPNSGLRIGHPGFAQTVDRLMAMPLDWFERDGMPMEFTTPLMAHTSWLVPTQADTPALVDTGVEPGRIWLTRELLTLLSVPGQSRELVRAVAFTKCEFDGEVVEVRAS